MVREGVPVAFIAVWPDNIVKTIQFVQFYISFPLCSMCFRPQMVFQRQKNIKKTLLEIDFGTSKRWTMFSSCILYAKLPKFPILCLASFRFGIAGFWGDRSKAGKSTSKMDVGQLGD